MAGSVPLRANSGGCWSDAARSTEIESRLRTGGLWIFDLDNTLYEASCGITAQLSARMTEYMMVRFKLSEQEANRKRQTYQRRFGTALSGLAQCEGITNEVFDYLDDINLSALKPSQDLAVGIAALPGRRVVYTNGTLRHAERVIESLGLGGVFDGIFDIALTSYVAKPRVLSYLRFHEAYPFDPRFAVMFDDQRRNLRYPYRCGILCILVGDESQVTATGIHLKVSRLEEFFGAGGRP